MPEPLTEEFLDDFKRRLVEGFNQREPRLIEEMLGPNLVDHSELMGKIDLRQRMGYVQEVVPDAHYEVLDRLVQGHAVAWKWRITGTHTNRILNIEPTGKPIELAGLSVAVIVNDKVVEHYEFADLPGLLRQIRS
jgi:predicted ester cyclase